MLPSFASLLVTVDLPPSTRMRSDVRSRRHEPTRLASACLSPAGLPSLSRGVNSQVSMCAQQIGLRRGSRGYRRASHSMEPRKATSAFTSPVGSFSQQAHIGSRANAVSGRPVRPSAGKQRAVSSSSHIRSRPLVAPSPHDDVVIATSPPRHDASAHLKHHLAHSPHSPGLNEAQRGVHASGSTTPGWMSDGQLPSQNTSRYWTQRLSSLAQAMSEELSFVGNAVLGKEGRANTATEEGVGQTVHRRSHSVPPEGCSTQWTRHSQNLDHPS